MKTSLDAISKGLAIRLWGLKSYYGCMEHPYNRKCELCRYQMDRYDRGARRDIREIMRSSMGLS